MEILGCSLLITKLEDKGIVNDYPLRHVLYRSGPSYDNSINNKSLFNDLNNKSGIIFNRVDFIQGSGNIKHILNVVMSKSYPCNNQSRCLPSLFDTVGQTYNDCAYNCYWEGSDDDLPDSIADLGKALGL